MSDINKEVEEFDQDIFDAMLHGTFEEAESVNEDTDAAEDFEEDDNEYQEDTDQEEESEDEDNLDGAGDGELDEDSDYTDDDEEEDSLVEDYDSDDEDDELDDEDEDADEADESGDEELGEGSEDEADTEGNSDGKAPDTDGIDYKAFYDAVVNTEFVVNGRKTKGFADPQKIIQSQQMAGGFSEKMAGFKQYRPFMAPLKERGMLDDQAKFDLAMNLLDGDKEAIKAHLKALEIDPLDLDMDKIEYSGKSSLASQESLVIEDVMERARQSGIEDRVRQVVGKDWDADSFREFTSNEAVRNDLLNHIETGAYDAVQDKMAEMSRLDYNGSFGSMTTINKYRAAVVELQRAAPQQQAPSTPAPKATNNTTASEKAKIVQARKEAEYKEKAAKQEAKLTQQRKRATSMSRKRSKPKPAKTKFDPMTVEGTELDNLMDALIAGGRA